MRYRSLNRFTALVLIIAMILGLSVTTAFAEGNQNSASETEWVEGPTVIRNPCSPTGYTVRFVYKNEEAENVIFAGDLLLRNWANPKDTKVYLPYEYRPGLMRGGGAFEIQMDKYDGGYWVIELPLAAGANQYWFYVDGDRNHWVTDPANPPVYAPDGLTGTARRAFNVVYVPYDSNKQDAVAGARAIENPRTDEKKGTWSYVALPAEIDSTRTRYIGVYLPYGYDENREEPYKLIIMQHGAQQDASDWMNIGSVPNIMDNLVAEGLTEPAVVVTTDAAYLGSAQEGYPNLFNIILPFLEEKYNISSDPMDRAFAGLSMGGMITTNIINYDPTTFGFFGIFSAGANIKTDTPNLDKTNILIGVGPWDNIPILIPTKEQLAALDNSPANYKYVEVAGAHDFNTWCQLFTIFARDYLWKPNKFKKIVEGPTVIKDPDSPTGYTVRFVYRNEKAQSVTFAADILLRNWLNPSDTRVYSPFEYKPGLMRGGGAYEAEMEKLDDGYWVIEVPMLAGANQYWFYVDGDRNNWVADPANSPRFAPDGLTGTARRAFNAVYVPYDPEKQDIYAGARAIENPRADEKKGTWDYVALPAEIDNARTRYVGVYLPYGYDENRDKPYKTIYLQHGGGQDASDWLNIGSVPNIMDNLLAEGLTEPAVVVTTDSTYLGSAQEGYPNLFDIIIPFIEENYNVSTDPKDRAFAGLSMGGGIAASLVNTHAADIGYFGVFSSGTLTSHTVQGENIDKTNIYIGNGLYENNPPLNRHEGAKLFMRQLDNFNAKYAYVRVAGGHDFNTWCQSFTIFARDYLWKPEMFRKPTEGPTVIKDSDSPTGYTVRFAYRNEDAVRVTFAADILLRNWLDSSDTKVYSPFEYKPGLMRGGGAYETEMQRGPCGYWVTEVPLTAGANQYWFYIDGNRDYWAPDPANMPRFAPDGLTGNARRAFNAVYVPYDPEKQDAIAGAREIENPRTDEKKGTWDYVALPASIDSTRTRYIGVYLPYGYDENREEPYKLIIMQHGGGQDASDWMTIGSVPNIMDNLLAEGLTEPAVVVTTDSTYLGNAQEGYPNLRNIILPFIFENYNVSTDPMDRAFAGLSMGSIVTSGIINYDATLFGYYGPWSGGVGVRTTTPNLDKTHILFAGGRYDFGLPSAAQVAAFANTDANYRYVVVAGGHDFNTWCQLFTIFARDYLWKPEKFRNIAEAAVSLDSSTVRRTKTVQARAMVRLKGLDNFISIDELEAINPDFPARVEYFSLNPSIATVDEKGVVTGVRPGTTEIQALVTHNGIARMSEPVKITVEPAEMAPVPVSIILSKDIVDVGEQVKATIKAEEAVDLYAAGFKVSYDPELFEVVDVKVDSGLGDDVSLMYKDDNGQLNIVLTLIGDDKAINGEAALINITFKAKDKDAVTEFIILEDSSFGNFYGDFTELGEKVSGRIAIARPDVTGDGVAINDLVLVAKAFGCAEGDPGYDPALDMNKDGVIDIIDIAYIAAKVMKK